MTVCVLWLCTPHGIVGTTYTHPDASLVKADSLFGAGAGVGVGELKGGKGEGSKVRQQLKRPRVLVAEAHQYSHPSSACKLYKTTNHGVGMTIGVGVGAE